MIKPEPIELENNLGPDAVTGEINRVPWMAYDVDEMDIYIAELEQKLAEKDKEIESLKASHYAERVDAGMRERRLKRALWRERAERAKEKAFNWRFRNPNNNNCLYGINYLVEYDERKIRRTNNEWFEVFSEVERKCRAKAEEYKR